MARKTLWQALLVVAGAVVAVALAYRAWDSTGRTPTSSIGSAAGNSGQRTAEPVASEATVPDLRLEMLRAAKPDPAEGGRNPFRFRPPPPPPPPPASAQPGGQPGEVSPSRKTDPAAPIPLKFIGIVDAPSGPGKVAVLSDGRFVFHGQEGEIVDGRYRIVSIGVESLVVEHVDGRGRQTIRLSGS